MGRGKRGRGGGGRGRGGRGGGGGGGGRRNQPDNRVSFENLDKHNEKLERFYNSINIVPKGEERDAFWAALRRELPNSFRFTGSKGHALSVRRNLVERYFPTLSSIEFDGKPVELPKELPWYPSGLAYQMTIPKNVIRKDQSFKAFQKFLVSETTVGNISRQEAVSMIPPLVLDVKPHHTVLDLCAAPGSKTAQLVEMIHAGEEERVQRAIKVARGENVDEGVPLEGGRSTGLLVANDVNYSRAQMLVHQVKRLNSPNFIVTNHDATAFPSIALPNGAAPGEQKPGKYLRFDRILADVPCSGDGTTRKNPGIWRDWSPQNGLGLYSTQCKILTRALQLLETGGRVVYSTCSMNPVEDEAVVSSAIERCGGVSKVKLVDCSAMLPELKRNPGLTDWSIMSRSGNIYESWAEAVQQEPPESKIMPGMFPPEPEEEIPLQHCMRLYPHQQDTGGFFVAVLEKISDKLIAKPENESKSSNKEWRYNQPVDYYKSSKKPGVAMHGDVTMGESASDIIQQVKTEPMDEGGHLRHHDPNVVATDSDPTAAQRSNEPTESLKRVAPEDDGPAGISAIKKPKLGDYPDDVVSTAETAIVQHHPVPPSTAMAADADGGALEPMRKPRKDGQEANVESFKYLDPEHEELQKIYKFYELDDSFPRDCFLVRNPAGDPVKGIYYSSYLVKDVLLANESRKMKFVHAGVKMFMKQDAQGQVDVCRWRIQTEGLPIIEGWIGEKRVIKMWRRSTLKKLIIEMFPKVGGEHEPEGEGWRALGEIGETILHMKNGCALLRIETRDDPDGNLEPDTLPIWRSINSVNLMLPKDERKAMLLRIFNEEHELVNHTDRDRKTNGNANGKDHKGSIPAQEDAEEVQRRLKNDEDPDLKMEEDGDPGDAALALEEDVLAERDDLERAKLEEMEDENTKVTNAMPERDHEGDDYNTTV